MSEPPIKFTKSSRCVSAFAGDKSQFPLKPSRSTAKLLASCLSPLSADASCRETVSTPYHAAQATFSALKLAKERHESRLYHLISMHCQLSSCHALAMSTLQTQKNTVLAEAESFFQQATEQLNADLREKERGLAQQKARLKAYLEDSSRVLRKLEKASGSAKCERVKHEAQQLLENEYVQAPVTQDWLEFPTDYFPYKLVAVNSASAKTIRAPHLLSSSLSASPTCMGRLPAGLSKKENTSARSTRKLDRCSAGPTTPRTLHRKVASQEDIRHIKFSKLHSETTAKLRKNQVRLYIPTSADSQFYTVTVGTGVTSQQLLEEAVAHMNIMGEEYVVGVKYKGQLRTLPAKQTILQAKVSKNKKRFYLYKPNPLL